MVFHVNKFPFADSRGDFFGSLSAKCVPPSKPFFIPCDFMFQSSSSTDVSPYIPTSHDSTPFFNMHSSSHSYSLDNPSLNPDPSLGNSVAGSHVLYTLPSNIPPYSIPPISGSL